MKDKNFYRQVFSFLYEGYITRFTSEVMAEFKITRSEAVKVLNNLCDLGLADKQLYDEDGFGYSHRKQRPGVEMLWNSYPNCDQMELEEAVKVFDEKFK
jgi:hypothetical protein